MKFSFNRNAMINEIAIAQETISEKNSAVIYSYVSLTAEGNSLTIRATDTKMKFIARLPVQAETEGTAIVLCSKLMGILSQLPEGEIEFEVVDKDGEKEAVIKHSTKKIRFRLRCRPESVEAVDFSGLDFISIPASALKEMIVLTTYAVSNEKNKFIMNGVLLEKDGDRLNLVATDSRRLAFASRAILSEVDEFRSIIVHPKILSIFAKYASDEGNVEIAVTENDIVLRFSNYTISASLIEGLFPNYRRVIPEAQPKSFKVDREEFMSALKRISVMSDKIRVFLDITPGVLSIHASSEDGDAREEIPCEFAGEPMSIAMNQKYLDDALRPIESDVVLFAFSEPLRPVTLSPEPKGDDFCILTPMQL